MNDKARFVHGSTAHFGQPPHQGWLGKQHLRLSPTLGTVQPSVAEGCRTCPSELLLPDSPATQHPRRPPVLEIVQQDEAGDSHAGPPRSRLPSAMRSKLARNRAKRGA